MCPKYSFVLPAYKATFLREAIESILSQSYIDFELIIVNDASPEDLTSIVNSYDDERIRYYINEKNVGGTDLVAQWNHCIEYALGEYLILASDDDIYHLDYLEKMNVLVDKYPNVDVYGSQIQYIDSNGNLIGDESHIAIKQVNEYLSQVDFVYLRNKGVISSGIPYYIFRSNALLAIGGFLKFPTAWFSDDATVIRLARNGIVTHNDILFSFRYSGLNISCVLNDSEMLLRKLSATDSFYSWYKVELNNISVKGVDDEEKISTICAGLHDAKLRHMIWLICTSERMAMLKSLCNLLKIETLSFADYITIYMEVFKTKLFTQKSK